MSNKGWIGHFFEDFHVGLSLACPTPRTLTSGDVSAYIGFTGDRTASFCGPSGLVHPLVTFHLVLGQTVRQVSLNARANLGYAGMRWGAPVRVGDTVRSRIEVVGLKENSNRKTGIVYVHTVATNQRDEVVLAYWRWVMVKKRGEDATPWLDAPVVPSLPEAVEPQSLAMPAEAPAGVEATGASWAWEDYALGERIHHHDGATVNPTDHMAFTRLFQNSAKIHFDTLLTDGKPLVYGGFPMSLGYAQALSGLENRGGIAAINAGAHANPVYAGHTLYSFTDVLEKPPGFETSAWAPLRLRMVVVKDENPAQHDGEWPVMVEDSAKPGRNRHNPAVVLDLDYWEWVPTRQALDQGKS